MRVPGVRVEVYAPNKIALKLIGMTSITSQEPYLEMSVSDKAYDIVLL